MKVHLVFPYAALYRQPIYILMDEHFDCQFHFCKNDNEPLKKMNYEVLKDCRFDIREYKIYGQWKCFKGLLSIDFDPGDIIITPGNVRYISLWLLMLKNIVLRKKWTIIPWTHAWYGKESWFLKQIKKAYYSMASYILLYGNYAKVLMQQEGFKEDKLKVIYNSLNYDDLLILRNSLSPSNIYKEHFGNNNPVLIMIGRLNLRKKLNLLIQALSCLKVKGEYYNVVLIGDGEDRAALEELVNSKGLTEQVWFFGACYDEKQNAELIFNSDMCVVPGDIGLTAIHTMMFGVPSLSHDYYPIQGPEFEAIKSDETGCFYKRDHVDSLADNISKWFKKHGQEREKIRNNCYREIDSHWNPHVQLEVLKNIIKGN